MRALILEPEFYEPDLVKQLESCGVSCHCISCKEQDQLVEILDGNKQNGRPYEAIFAKLGLDFNEKVFAAAGLSLKILVTPTTGLSHIDLANAEHRNIKVQSLKGQTEFLEKIPSTAEHTWALLLALIRKIPPAHSHVCNFGWNRSVFIGCELSDKQLGIVGLGRLGTILARYGRAFDMNVVAFDILDTPFEKPDNQHVRKATLHEVFVDSDVISIHLPLDQTTLGLIDRSCINKMKRSAFLVNTSRGELIDEKALISALKSKLIAGAALDVISEDASWCGEVPAENELIFYARKNTNLILTPHIGGYTREAIEKTRQFVVRQFLESIE